MHHAPAPTWHRTPRHLPALAALAALVLGATMVTPEASATTAATEPATVARVAAEPTETPVPRPVQEAVASVHRLTDGAARSIRRHRWGRAKSQLRGLRGAVGRAHDAAVVQMNAVPTDPEAEESDGPPSVVAVLAAEQRSVILTSRLFDRLHRVGVSRALRSALTTTQQRRSALLAAVTSLDPEGEGDDYADGMSDTLGGYGREVTTVRTALRQDRLRPLPARALRETLRRSIAAQATMLAAYGGGERRPTRAR